LRPCNVANGVAQNHSEPATEPNAIADKKKRKKVALPLLPHTWEFCTEACSDWPAVYSGGISLKASDTSRPFVA
jgi:hypothetical protein